MTWGVLFVTLEQLNYVIEVSKTGSMNKAANNLFISQSTLSVSIQNLEKELGAALLVRKRHGVELTPFGNRFVSYLIPIQLQLRQLRNMASAHNHDAPIFSFTIANDGFHQPAIICAKLFNKYQAAGIRIEQYDSYGDEARKLVAGDVVEIGVIRIWSCYKKLELKQFESMDLMYHPVARAGLAITVGPNNPLYHADIASVRSDMLRDYSMIKYGYMDSGPFSDIVDKLGIVSNTSAVVTSSRAVIDEMLEYTSAYYLNSLWPDMRTDNKLRSILLDGTDIYSEMGWIVKRTANLSVIAREFTKMLEESMEH